MLPNLIIIGAMKCGTTSLHNYLDLHPQVYMSEWKELDFFTGREKWERGLEWYRSNFPTCARVAGESSTNYSKFPTFPGVPERMHRVIPNAKLVYVVRDPIERITSHYLDSVRVGHEKRTFAQALKNPGDSHYVYCSKYFMQLERYLVYYPCSSIMVITLGDLSRHRQSTLASLFRFLGVDPSFWHNGFSEVHNRSRPAFKETALGASIKGLRGSGRIRRWMPWLVRRRIERPKPSEKLRESLLDVLRDDVDKLRALTGRSFVDWSV